MSPFTERLCEIGYAFVYFEDESDAQNAIHGLNGRKLSEPGFHICKLVVKWAKNDRGSPSDPIPNITLFVANFDPILTKNHDIIRHFEPYGKVLGVRQLRDYAFVDFETQEIATKALECTHQSTLFDRLIRVEYASPRPGDDEKGRCDDPSNPTAMSPDPVRASPVYDRCDGPSNPRAMTPDPAQASPVDDRCDGPSNPRTMTPDPVQASPVDDRCDGPSNPTAMSPEPGEQVLLMIGTMALQIQRP
ncbi:serine/arginine-rich splicing factor RS31-like [Salvia hispanica]|uniref:serine/arginine-rich splicing factor RS31-like n=1 Tax=Salvia hispanica TaxID=49212 RepID=UPI0020091341|nr:serine/arginine-rich splicing factor RS31-like [Salvia hispanica]